MLRRFNAIWAAAANITVNLKTGKIQVDKYTGVVDPGIAVNPRQLQRNFEGGTVMGISEALHEQLTFDRGKITSVDWVTYPIMRMGELPEVATELGARRRPERALDRGIERFGVTFIEPANHVSPSAGRGFSRSTAGKQRSQAQRYGFSGLLDIRIETLLC